MNKIRLLDKNFAHATSCSNGDLKIYPSFFEWYRGTEEQDITVFVDSEITKVPLINSKIKIWMLLEPPTISPNLYQLAASKPIQDSVDYILTFNKSLCSLSDKFIYYPLGGCWIEPKDRQLYKKTKNVSIIASEKNFTEGHQLRHQLIKRYGNKIDVYGRGYNYIESKLTALKDYRYTIVIENCRLSGYFTEKIVDAFVTGTIPIYYGDPNINNHFNFNGIINLGSFDFIKPLDAILNPSEPFEYSAVYDLNNSMIVDNFERAKQFTNTEDWLWNNLFKKLCTTTQQT
jgi:hypothetical protein